MELSKIRYLGVLALIVVPLFMLGCSPSSPQEKKTTNVTEAVRLNSGAVLKFEEGNYKLYDYKSGKYEEVKSNYIISSYDKSSSTFVDTEEGKHYIVRDNQKYEINDSNYSNLKLSKGGEYVSYFIDDNGLKMKVFDTNGNKQIEIKSNVSISGSLYDWYDSNTLVYYGVSNDGINGLFTYNIKENKEELLYKIKEGFLAFLKGNDDNVVFLQISLENKKQLIMIDKKSKEIKLLTDNIAEITDIAVNNGKIYFTGKEPNNINSLYELENNEPKRLVYDFPTVVKIDKGLRVDDKGNILFIGSNSGDTDQEQIYTYTQDGSISSIAKNSTDYVFLECIN